MKRQGWPALELLQRCEGVLHDDELPPKMQGAVFRPEGDHPVVESASEKAVQQLQGGAADPAPRADHHDPLAARLQPLDGRSGEFGEGLAREVQTATSSGRSRALTATAASENRSARSAPGYSLA